MAEIDTLDEQLEAEDDPAADAAETEAQDEGTTEAAKPRRSGKRAPRPAKEFDAANASDRDRLKHALGELRKKGMTTASNTSGNIHTQHARLVAAGTHEEPGAYLPVDEVRRGFDRDGNIRAGDHVKLVFPAGDISDLHEAFDAVGLPASGLERVPGKDGSTPVVRISGHATSDGPKPSAERVHELLDILVAAAQSGNVGVRNESRAELEKMLEGSFA